MKEQRDLPLDQVRVLLGEWLVQEHKKSDGISDFGLTKRNRKHLTSCWPD